MSITARPPDVPTAARRRCLRRPFAPGRHRGQAIVELAVIMPVLLVLLAAGADLARIFHSQVSIESAARAGALEAAANPTSFTSGAACNASTNRVMCAVLTESSGSFFSISPIRRHARLHPLAVCGRARQHGRGPRRRTLHAPDAPPVGVLRRNEHQPDPERRRPDRRPSEHLRRVRRPPPRRRPRRRPRHRPQRQRPPRPAPIAPTPTPTPAPTPTPTPFCAPPTADFTISPSSGKKKKTDFQFTDLSTTTLPQCPLTWSWNFGDGAGASSTSTLQNPIHQYQSQGDYTITLVVSNFGGNATRTRTVTVTN